jgi:hypothetical protein
VSLAAIKREMQSLTAAERAELRAYSKVLDLKENPQRQAELLSALNQALKEKLISSEEVRRQIEKTN